MKNKGLSQKEAALLAAARREIAKPAVAPPVRPAVPAGTTPSRATVPAAAVMAAAAQSAKPAARPVKAAPETPVLAPAAPVPDIATRMAMLIEAEREANESRKRRVKRIYLIAISAVMVPAFLYVSVTMFRVLAN